MCAHRVCACVCCAQDASLLTNIRAALALIENHGRETTSADASTVYVVPRAARERIAQEIAQALAEYDSTLRAPLRVVALGRSGVGKSHVLNQLLSELASRTNERAASASRREVVDGESGTADDDGLTIVRAIDHDEAAEEREADRMRALEDEGENHVSMAADASVFAPPPPLDRDKSRVVYVPRHMKGRAIAGEAASFADEVQIRKDRIKELSAKLSKKNARKVKPSYALYKEEMEAKARQAAAKVAEQRKREDYERIITEYEIPVRDRPFKPPLVPIDDFLSYSPSAPFLLPEGDILDTTSVASSVSTSDAFRVTLIYFAEEVVKKHLHALNQAAREARLVAKHRPHLGFFADKFAKNELKEQGLNELTLLDFASKPKNSDGSDDDDDTYGLPSVLRVACAMVGLDPNRSSLDTVEEAEVALPAEYIKRLGKRVTFEYRPEGKECIDYSDEETFRRGLMATKRTLVTQTHISAACWGLLREVRVEIPVPEHKRGLVLIDAPGAGDSDPARDRHLVAALRNAAAVICLGDARDVTGDIVRALHKSGFLQQLTIRPATRRFINAIQGDRVWGSTLTTFRTAQQLLRERLGKDMSLEEFMQHQPPKREDIQWAVDHVIRENSSVLADIRRTELLSMLTDPNGSVHELPQVANAIGVVAWKFLEIRSSWARVLDASKIDVQKVTGHGSLYAELDVLKQARKLKLVRRVTKRVHDALRAFCTAAGPMHALPESSDESLRGLHESLELAFGERGEYASKVIHRDTMYFIRRTCATLFREEFKAFSDRVAGKCQTSTVRAMLKATFANAPRTLRVSDVHHFAKDATQVIEVLFRDAFCLNADRSSSDVLYCACSAFVNGWYKTIAAEDEQSLHAFAQKTLMDLTGDEEDPKCAMVRAIVSIAVAKFKLSPASKSAYLSHGQKKEAIRGLHAKLVKDLSKELLTQTKAIKAGIVEMFDVEDVKDDAHATEDETENFFNNCTTLVSSCAVTVTDAITDALHEGITAWIQPAMTAGSKDAMKSVQQCLMPLIKKQVMPDFRARVAKRSMLTIINEDIANVEKIMSVTADVLGSEAKSDPSQLEKAKRLAELSRMGDEPLQLYKLSVPMPPPNPAFRASDDVVQVDLSEFPIRIYATNLEVTDDVPLVPVVAPVQQVIQSAPAVEAVVAHPSPPIAEETTPDAPPVQIKLDIRIVSPEPVNALRSPSIGRREIAVQTEDMPSTLPTVAVQTEDKLPDLPTVAVQTQDTPSNLPTVTVEAEDKLPDLPTVAVQTQDTPSNLPTVAVQTQDKLPDLPTVAVQTQDKPPDLPTVAVQTQDKLPDLPTVAVQTQDKPSNLPTVIVAPEPKANIVEAPKQNSSSKSGKSDVTATPTPATRLRLDSPQAPSSQAPKSCNHCGDTSSSVWKKGPSIKPTLCVACRDYLDKRWTLPKLSRKSRNNTPIQNNIRSPHVVHSPRQHAAPTDPSVQRAPKTKEDSLSPDVKDVPKTKHGRLSLAHVLADDLDVSDADDSPVPKGKIRLEWMREDGEIKSMKWGTEAWKPLSKADSPRETTVRPKIAEACVQRLSPDPSTTFGGPSTSGMKRKRPIEGATAADTRVIEASKSKETAPVTNDTIFAFESEDDEQDDDDDGEEEEDAENPTSESSDIDAVAPQSKKSPLAALDALGDDDDDEERWVNRFANLHSPTKRPRT